MSMLPLLLAERLRARGCKVFQFDKDASCVPIVIEARRAEPLLARMRRYGSHAAKVAARRWRTTLPTLAYVAAVRSAISDRKARNKHD